MRSEGGKEGGKKDGVFDRVLWVPGATRSRRHNEKTNEKKTPPVYLKRLRSKNVEER